MSIIFYTVVALCIPIFIYFNRKYDRWSWYTVKSYQRGTYALKFPCQVTSRCVQSVDMKPENDPKIFTITTEPFAPPKRTILAFFCPPKVQYNRSGYRDEVETIACRSVSRDAISREIYNSVVHEIEKLTACVDDKSSVVDQSLNATQDGTWIAADYDTEKSCFSSPINNIPLLESPSLTSLLGQVFAKMLPMFERVLNAPLRRDGPLKVFVDIMAYNIGENNSIKNVFHKEGQDICALGYYFPNIDALVGGDIELQMNVPFIHDDHSNYTWYKGQHVVTTRLPVEENSMIVFSNQNVYHRMIQAESKESFGKRYVVGFFLASPWSAHVPSSSKHPAITHLLTGAEYTTAKERRNRELDLTVIELTSSCTFQGRIPKRG